MISCPLCGERILSHQWDNHCALAHPNVQRNMIETKAEGDVKISEYGTYVKPPSKVIVLDEDDTSDMD